MLICDNPIIYTFPFGIYCKYNSMAEERGSLKTTGSQGYGAIGSGRKCDPAIDHSARSQMGGVYISVNEHCGVYYWIGDATGMIVVPEFDSH